MKHLKNSRGQGLVEYMVIVALMAVGTMGLMRILSTTTNGKITQITQSLQGGEASVSVKFEKIDKKDLRKKDMGDFFRGSRSRRDR